MLRRLNVRTRLVAVIAVPLVLLLAVVVPEILERRGRAADAGRAAAITTHADDVAAAVDALQGERTLAAAVRAGAGPDVVRALEDQRSTTDPAVERAISTLDRLAAEHDSLAGPAASAATQLDRLPVIREAGDSAADDAPWTDPFAPAIDALLDVQEAAASVSASLGVGNGLSSVAIVANAKEAASAQAAELAAASTWGELRGEQAAILADLRADEAAYRATYLTTSPSNLQDARRDALETPEGATAGRMVDGMAAGGEVADLTSWLDASDARQQVLREVEADRIVDARRTAESVEATSDRASNGYLVLAGSGLLLAFALALAVAQSITRPLRELTDAANHLAEDRLPQLVDALRNPVEDDEHYLAAAMEPIAVRAHDELGNLARSFNTVQSVAVDVAAEQASLLKKGISELYVNLARRNQALLDRQIQMLDQLEREEQDPEVLEHLYLLDHLATRMRRNAESLLVLAGAESGPRRTQPISLIDVVRAAVSEVEEYERVDLGTLAEATLHGPAVSDVAHLVAELLENATQFSPPESMVRVDGARTGGSYQLVISDRGVGMRPEQLEQLNDLLRDPPVTGLALGRSLGCLVAARLASRHDITVRLRAAEGEGVAAYVVLPRHLLVEQAADTPGAATAGAGGAVDPAEVGAVRRRRPLPKRPDLEAQVAAWEAPETVEPLVVEPLVVDPRAVEPVHPVPDHVGPDRLDEALPTADFEAGIQALLQEETGDDPSAPGARRPTASEPVDEPAMSGAATLTRRVPGATAEALPEPPAHPPVRRDPDEVRHRLSRYRSGLTAGRTNDGQPAPAADDQEGS
jgi:signal transduction histidine kinase